MLKEFIASWGWFGAIIVNGFLGWVLWSLRKSFPTRAEHQTHADRLTNVEHELKRRPTFQDMQALEQRLSAIDARQQALAEKLDALCVGINRLGDQLNMIYEAELRVSRGKQK